MAGQTRVLQFAEGESVEAPTTTFLQTTSYATYANDAAYEAAVGAAANGGSYYNSTDHVVRVYLNGAWTTEMNGAFLYLYVNENGNQAAADGLSGFEVQMSDATNARITYSSTAASRFIMGDAGSESEVMTVGTAQTVSGIKTHSAQIVSSATTEATDKDTGTFVTEGGIGVEKSVHAGVSVKTDGFYKGASANDTATGSNVTLTLPATSTVRLTDGSLSSVDMIPAGVSEQFLKLVNATGGQVTINNDTGGTAANRVLTGTGSNLTLEDEASLLLRYDATEARWMVVGGSGSGGGAGVFNYIEEGDGVTIASWVSYANTTAGDAPDDFGGTASGNFTLTSNTTSPLRGTTDMDFAKAASNEQGEGYYYPFTLRRGDKAAILRFVLNYIASANYATGDIRFYVVSSSDSFVADFNVIPLNPVELDARTLESYFNSEFQTDASDTDYRFCVHVASTNASAYDLNMIMELGPRVIQKGAVQTSWENFTPTGTFTTNTTYDGYYRRVGSNLEMHIYIEFSGAPNAATFAVNTPNGEVIDTGVLMTTDTDNSSLGYGSMLDSGAADFGPMLARYQTTTSIGLGAASASSSGRIQFVSNTAPFSIASGDRIYMYVNVPILGWSSNAVMSSAFTNRQVALIAHSNPGSGSITASVTDLQYTVTEVDTTNSWDGSQYTFPEDGVYIAIATTRTTGTSTSILFYKDGSTYGRMHTGYGSAASNAAGVIGIYALAGEVGSIRINSSTSYQNASDQIDHRLTIFKISTPETLLGAESYNASARNNGATVLTANTTDIDFSTEDYDTHGAWDGSGYTAFADQIVELEGMVRTSTNFSNNIETYIDGSQDKVIGIGRGSQNTPFSGAVRLLKGERLSLRSNAGVTLQANALFHHIAITKISN